MSIPEIIVIGSMKSGTSTVWKGLFHAERFDPTRKKEVNYFLEDRDLEDYQRLYSFQFEKSSDRIKVDISPDYSRRHLFPGVPQRIHQANPKAKIVYLVRRPFDRIVSHLHHDIYRDRIRPDQVEKAIKENRDYLLTTSYYYQLEEYIQFFGRESILVLGLEQLHTNPSEFWSAFARFASVPDFAVPTDSFNVSEKRYLIKYHDQVHEKVSNSYLLKAYHLLWYFINIKYPKPVLNESLREFIKTNLIADSARLSTEFGINTNNWFK